MRAAIYARVSTPRQARDRNTDQQLARLERYAEQKGWVLDGERVYLDEDYSGASLNRPGLDALRDGEWLPQELKARISGVEEAIAQTERQDRRLLDAYLGGVVELAEFERKRGELQGRSDALLAQKRQLEATARERTELSGIADSIEEFCEQVKATLFDATFEQKRALVELLIDRVIVAGEEVEIRYVVPTSPDGPHQPFCHLRTDYLDGPPRREVAGQKPPRAAALRDVEDSVEESPWAMDPRSTAGLRGRKMRRQAAPFGVGEIGRIYGHATERTLSSSCASYFSDSFGRVVPRSSRNSSLGYG